VARNPRPPRSPESPEGSPPPAPPAPPAASPADGVYDSEGRRADGHWLSYSEYVNVPALLAAQRLPREVPKGRTRAEWPSWPHVEEDGATRPWRPGDPWPSAFPHDEHLFILVHQTFELWFKQILHDLDEVLASASEVGKAHGATIPRADATASAEWKSLTAASLGLFPRLSAAAEPLGAAERRWLLEMPVPGHARSPSRRWTLSWVDGATLSRWTARLARCAKALVHATGAFDVLATMTPSSFLEFRGRLVPASGFGSTQFREIEILSGLAEARASMAKAPQGERVAGLSASIAAPSPSTPREAADLSLVRHLPREELARIDRRLAAPTLRDLVAALLDGPEVCAKDVRAFRARIDEVAAANVTALHLDYRRESSHPQPDLKTRMSSRWQEIGRLMAPPENVGLSWLYRHPDEFPSLVSFLDAAFEWDQALVSWRNAHVPFVERMIGARPGTGGGGLEYLRRTLDLPRALPWLWDFRTILMAPT
jgi:tryptophan 2,3-dioxygenase